MKDITTVGLDLAKNVFYVHVVDSRGKTVLKKKLSRAKGRRVLVPIKRNTD